jgi:hypothetical protein
LNFEGSIFDAARSRGAPAHGTSAAPTFEQARGTHGRESLATDVHKRCTNVAQGDGPAGAKNIFWTPWIQWETPMHFLITPALRKLPPGAQVGSSQRTVQGDRSN